MKVGKLQGKALVAALRANGKYGSHPVIAELNGDIKDNNAKLFKSGYDSILGPLYKSGAFKKAKAGDQWTQWDPIKGRQIFDQILARNGNKVDGTLAANDGLAGAVIASLKAHGLKAILLTPVWITKANYKLLFKEGFLKRGQVCNGQYSKFCK